MHYSGRAFFAHSTKFAIYFSGRGFAGLITALGNPILAARLVFVSIKIRPNDREYPTMPQFIIVAGVGTGHLGPP